MQWGWGGGPHGDRMRSAWQRCEAAFHSRGLLCLSRRDPKEQKQTRWGGDQDVSDGVGRERQFPSQTSRDGMQVGLGGSLPGKRRSTFLSKRIRAAGGANLRGTLQPKKPGAGEVYFICIYYHNTEYTF